MYFFLPRALTGDRNIWNSSYENCLEKQSKTFFLANLEKLPTNTKEMINVDCS